MIHRTVGLCLRVCICRGVYLFVYFLLCRKLCRPVYVELCVYVVCGVVRGRIDGLGVCLDLG